MRLTSDQRALAGTVRDVLDERAPIDVIRAAATAGSGLDEDLWHDVSALGWAALLVPERFGGIELGLADAAVVAREVGRSGASTALLATLAASFVIDRHGSEHQRSSWLPDIASGQLRIAAAVTTPDQVSVTVDPRSPVQLCGRVRPVADVAAATHVLLPFDGADSGLALLPVESVSRDPITTIDLTRRYDELGLDAVAVPSEDVLPPQAQQTAFNALVVLQCAETLGAAERLMDMTITYLQQRQQFGRLIGSFQALQHRCADMAIELAGAGVAVQHAALQCDLGSPEASEAVSVAAAWVGPNASWLAGEALQLHGGIGFTWEHHLHVYLRRIKANELVLGTPRWHRERVLAEVLRRR
jgi:alkylation response protein AidB-like acyl-CoA dehydrogenase